MPALDTWWDRAACRDVDPIIFEPPPAKSGPRGVSYGTSSVKWTKDALAVCATCEVQPQCLRDYLAAETPYVDTGRRLRFVVGGRTPLEIDRLLEQRRTAS